MASEAAHSQSDGVAEPEFAFLLIARCLALP